MKSLDGLYIPVKGHTNVFALLGNRDKYRPFLKKSEVGGKSSHLKQIFNLGYIENSGIRDWKILEKSRVQNHEIQEIVWKI